MTIFEYKIATIISEKLLVSKFAAIGEGSVIIGEASITVTN